MGKWNYVHAEQVLPAPLVKAIRQYVTGLVYIPTDTAQVRQRTALRVRALKEQGFRNCEIARILGITPRHVCGVLRRFQETTAPASPADESAANAPQACQSAGGERPPSPRA